MKGAGTFWYAVRPLVFISLPYDRVIQPTRLDLFKMFSLHPALVLRYPARSVAAQMEQEACLCASARDTTSPH